MKTRFIVLVRSGEASPFYHYATESEAFAAAGQIFKEHGNVCVVFSASVFYSEPVSTDEPTPVP